MWMIVSPSLATFFPPIRIYNVALSVSQILLFFSQDLPIWGYYFHPFFALFLKLGIPHFPLGHELLMGNSLLFDPGFFFPPFITALFFETCA